MNLDVQQESSTATMDFEAPVEGTPEYDHWRKTGELGGPAKKEESPASKKQEPSAAEATEEVEKTESARAPEAGKESTSQDKKDKGQRRSNASTRIEELRRELGEDATQEVLQALLAAKKGKASVKQATPKTQADSSPAAAKESPNLEPPQPPNAGEDLKPPVKPKAEDYASKPYAEYEAAVDKFHEEMADYKAKMAVRDFQQNQHKQAQQQYWNAQMDIGRQAYEGFDDKIEPVMKMGWPPLLGHFIGQSPVAPHLLWVLAGTEKAKVDQLISLGQRNPFQAQRQLLELERTIVDELNGKARQAPAETTERNGKGQFTSQSKPNSPPPAKTVTTAPPIGKTLNARATSPPADDVESAVDAEDQAAYMNKMNALDLQKRRR